MSDSKILPLEILKKKPLPPSGKFIDDSTYEELVQGNNNVNPDDMKFLFGLFQHQVHYLVEALNSKSFIRNLKIYKEIFDTEIMCEVCLDVMPIIPDTKSMKNWTPFPFYDNGVSYYLYKEERYKNGIGWKVTDGFMERFLASIKSKKELQSDSEKQLKQAKRDKSIKSSNKGGRPKDPEVAKKREELNKRHYHLTEKEGLKKSHAITSFNNNKPPKYLTDFVKGLDLKSNVFSFYSPLSNFLNASKSNSFP